MRAPRAYLAGFGTSGSLLAGAALMFVLASALVAFRGWPQVADQAPTTAVSVSQPGPGAGSRDARRLSTALAVRVAPGHPAAVGPRGHPPARARRAHNGASGAPAGSRPGTATGSGSPASASVLPGCTGSGCTAPVGGGVPGVSGAVAQGVSSAGSTAGPAVTSVAKTVAGNVSGTSPQVAGAVQNAGASAGSTVSGTATTVAGTVTALGGGH